MNPIYTILTLVLIVITKSSVCLENFNSSGDIYRNIGEILSKYQSRQSIRFYPDGENNNYLNSQYGLYYPDNSNLNQINSNYGLYYPNNPTTFPLPGQPGISGGNLPFLPGYPNRYQSQNTINDVLNSITQYDTFQCIPRLLCEMTVGRTTQTHAQSSSSSLTSFLPSLDLSSLISLIEAFNPGGQPTPLFVFGKAALLGYSSSGDKYACYRAYPRCPRDPDDLVEYLNNHNGGFFRFFSGLQNSGYPPNPYPANFYRPYPLQRNEIESRIQTKPERDTNGIYTSGNYLQFGQIQPEVNSHFKTHSWKFPQNIPQVHQSYYENSVDGFRKGKTLTFVSKGPTGFGFVPDPNTIKVVFPDRTGTGELLIDTDKYPPPEHIRYETNFYDSNLNSYRLKFPTNFEGNRLI